MRRFIFGCLCCLSTGLSAQGHFRTAGFFSVGDGKLHKPYAGDLGLSININGQFNYVNGAFIGSIGFGGVLLNDTRRIGYFGNVSKAELFAEIPAGIGARLHIGAGSFIIIGSDLSFLYNPGDAHTNLAISPHFDILYKNKHGSNNGVFLKAMFGVSGDGEYEPRYIGIGYKVMYPPIAKKVSRRKTAQHTVQ